MNVIQGYIEIEKGLDNHTDSNFLKGTKKPVNRPFPKAN